VTRAFLYAGARALLYCLTVLRMIEAEMDRPRFEIKKTAQMVLTMGSTSASLAPLSEDKRKRTDFVVVELRPEAGGCDPR
jgi:hypothetical protein